ncbi:MAG: copper chaperone PCu(A)C [Pseudomonadota bacterium]
MTRIPNFAKVMVLSVFALCACSGEEHAQQDKTAAAPATVEGDISVTPGFARKPPKGASATAGYIALSSEVDDKLLSVTSPDAGAVELHTAGMVDGVMRMRQLDNIALPAGEFITLEPGGLHLMIMQPSDRLAQAETIELTLHFEKADPMIITLPLKGIGDSTSHGQ